MIENPIGLLEKVVVTSCRVEYEHTFIVVDFGKNLNYDIIIGWTFMRQLKMIQYWGFNYIYLWHEDAITHVNLAGHSYRDMVRMLVEDFESATMIDKSLISSWINSQTQVQMCGASECGSLEKERCTCDHEEAYILEPFLEAQLEPTAWRDVLATVDVCVQEITP